MVSSGLVMAAHGAQTRVKPRLRGVLHEFASFLTLPATALLIAMASSRRAAVAAAVYGMSLTAMFGSSALYHRPIWSVGARDWLQRLDRAAIFLLVAGTSTPFYLLLDQGQGRALLAVAWGGAIIGILQALLWAHAPNSLNAAIYVAFGWVFAFFVPRFHAAVGVSGIGLLVAGGLLYSFGALIYALRRPDPVPAVFGYHEVFHALVIAASVCHFVVVQAVIRSSH